MRTWGGDTQVGLTEPYCPRGCTDHGDYEAAERARLEGREWVPREPSHCGVTMVGGEADHVVNGQRMQRFFCTICRASEMHPAQT